MAGRKFPIAPFIQTPSGLGIFSRVPRRAGKGKKMDLNATYTTISGKYKYKIVDILSPKQGRYITLRRLGDGEEIKVTENEFNDLNKVKEM